jgi:uncharacterized protein with FMN-binding domain
MISKRLFLILGGTVGGLGAVVSITPPQFGTSGGLKTLGSKSTPTTPAAPVAPTQTATAVPANPTTPTQPSPTATTKTKKKKKTVTKATAAPAVPAQTQAPAAPQSASVTGTFTGNAAQTAYGPVQVQVTVSNGKITRATALTYPQNSGRDRQINSQAIPLLIQETLQAQSANIQGVGGASYTSQGWYDSLVSALKKAGM